jgi:translation initiation factor 2 alpha subunit (eIF-2alpha)
MRHVADTVDLDLETVCERVTWPLYRKYGHTFNAFKLVTADTDVASTIQFPSLSNPKGREDKCRFGPAHNSYIA